jgi:hypothetical protein
MPRWLYEFFGEVIGLIIFNKEAPFLDLQFLMEGPNHSHLPCFGSTHLSQSPRFPTTDLILQHFIALAFSCGCPTFSCKYSIARNARQEYSRRMAPAPHAVSLTLRIHFMLCLGHTIVEKVANCIFVDGTQISCPLFLLIYNSHFLLSSHEKVVCLTR